MGRIDVILDQLASAKQRQAYDECIALCREGRYLSTSPNEVYVFQSNLVRFLLVEKREVLAEDIEEAIEIYSEMISMLPNMGRKRATALMGLGWACFLRTRGDLLNNLKQAVAFYEEALNYYTRENDPHTWASIKAVLGLIYSSMPTDASQDVMAKSLNSYEESLQVFTAEAYPDDWKEITDQFNRLKEKWGIER